MNFVRKTNTYVINSKNCTEGREENNILPGKLHPSIANHENSVAGTWDSNDKTVIPNAGIFLNIMKVNTYHNTSLKDIVLFQNIAQVLLTTVLMKPK